MESVAAFTDTYLPTINGVSYTVRAWRDRWIDRGGRMPIVYPRADGHRPTDGEHPVRSLPFPFYEGYRLALPSIPDDLTQLDVIHAHTPFSLGIAAVRLARRKGLPVVASYHTPTSEYTDYLAPTDRLSSLLQRTTEAYERWFFDRVDVVLAPSEATRTHLSQTVGVDTPVEVLTNGVETEHFRPVDPAAFLARNGIDADRPLIGYTGRHGYEKCLEEIIEATAPLDVTVLFGGDGPARDELEAHARDSAVDARFLGFLDREELPAFYSALDVFAFPSPVETQGLVALEANACGTPVVGVDSGALGETIDDGVTGYHFPPDDTEAFRAGLQRALANQETLREACLDRRESISVARSIDRLETVYADVQ
ncbi:MAG: glycosyltransferase family 4 protein [Halobacteriales archaeon]|nr:glycosyltransferase family 4 protein [Halobacteriales archaeon]